MGGWAVLPPPLAEGRSVASRDREGRLVSGRARLPPSRNSAVRFFSSTIGRCLLSNSSFSLSLISANDSATAGLATMTANGLSILPFRSRSFLIACAFVASQTK